MERSETEPCKIGLTMEEHLIFRLKIHALELSKANNYRPTVRPSDVVKCLITEHIPDYRLVDVSTGESFTLAELRARESVIADDNHGTSGAKSRGSKRDGKEQADRARGRARG